MKFIYCMNEEVSKDLEASGLKKIGQACINGKPVDIYANSRTVYISKYQKQEVLLSNRLFFGEATIDLSEDEE